MAAGRVHHVDLAVLAGEAQGVPFLRLAAIAPAPCLGGDIRRQVVGEPAARFRKQLDRPDAGLLGKLAQRGLERILAGVEAALRHLPDVREVDVLGPVEPAADEDAAITVEHHGADAGAIRKIFIAGHRTVMPARRAPVNRRRCAEISAIDTKAPPAITSLLCTISALTLSFRPVPSACHALPSQRWIRLH